MVGEDQETTMDQDHEYTKLRHHLMSKHAKGDRRHKCIKQDITQLYLWTPKRWMQSKTATDRQSKLSRVGETYPEMPPPSNTNNPSRNQTPQTRSSIQENHINAHPPSPFM